MRRLFTNEILFLAVVVGLATIGCIELKSFWPRMVWSVPVCQSCESPMSCDEAGQSICRNPNCRDYAPIIVSRSGRE